MDPAFHRALKKERGRRGKGSEGPGGNIRYLTAQGTSLDGHGNGDSGNSLPCDSHTGGKNHEARIWVFILLHTN